MDELLGIAPCGILVFDDGGRILEANATLTSWLGYEAQGLKGRNMDIILSVASRVFYNTHFFPLIKLHSRADEIFLTLVAAGGDKSIPVLANAVRRTTSLGVENVVVFMPVPERKKFEDEILHARKVAESALAESRELQLLTQNLESHARALERQNQKIQSINEDLVQFNKIISHDLQEPIRKIRLFTDMLLQSQDESFSVSARRTIQKIEKSAEGLTELTAGLQQYVKVVDDVPVKVTDLNERLETAAGLVKQKRNFDDFQLSFRPMPEIEGYPTQLELLFFHILDNAIQFRDVERPLIVTIDHTILEENLYRATPDKYEFVEHIRIVFSDNGIGFDNEFKEQVFQFGKRAHLSRNGLGVGLALIKKIVSNHMGTISINAESGKGTDVILLLPIRQIDV